MTINQLTVTILFLFLPGLVCAVLVSKLTTHRQIRPVEFIIPSFIYGFLIYICYIGISKLWNAVFTDSWDFPIFNIIPDSEASTNLKVSAAALILAVFIAFILSLVFSAVINGKVLHRISRKIGVTRKFGDGDVWSYIMNSDETDWLVVRDRQSDLFYVGRIKAFSDEEEQREVILRNTVVYDNITGKELYVAGSVYFAFTRNNITLEFPD